MTGAAEDPDGLAAAMLRTCLVQEQCARRVPDEGLAQQVRARLRVLARARGVRIRTARMADAVVVVLADAAVWHEDAATMRQKLTPR